MFGKRFLLNEETLPVVEEIGRHMPGGFFIYKAADEELLYLNLQCIIFSILQVSSSIRSLKGS